MRRMLLSLLLWLSPSFCSFAWSAHAFALFGDIKYPPGFSHFDYVNPDAPKGGELVLVPPTRITNFDKYNPFTLKGTPAPNLPGLVIETLLTGTLDEPTTAYGLLAEDVVVARDRLSVVFRLHPAARFHNGDPVLAQDVQHSFERLISKEAAPQFRSLYADVKSVTVLDARTIRFEFKRVNHELPLILGGLPVFSAKWGAGKPFDQVVTDIPIGSGPYRIGRVNFGRDITYVRDPTYWARDLGVRRGTFNFDRITLKIYKDSTARLEAFKAGEFDFLQEFVARDWARAYRGKRFNTGELVKHEFPHRNAAGFQGFIFNLRKPKFQDVRVRRAIELAMDFEWMNRQLFYGAYRRLKGYFAGSDFEATGRPGPDELALLEPLRAQLPPAVFGELPQPPSTALPRSLRNNLREARRLLNEAGWTYRDGALRNAQGEAFTIEIIDSQGGMGRVVTPFSQALEKLGIQVDYRMADFALLQKRLDVFDFEVTSMRFIAGESPGNELFEYYGSKAADTEGSNNYWGIKDPAVDVLINRVVSATTRPQLVTAARALDRVLTHGHYSVTHWYSGTHRVAYRPDKFAFPQTMPLYYQPEGWAMSVWWANTRTDQQTEGGR